MVKKEATAKGGLLKKIDESTSIYRLLPLLLEFLEPAI